MDDSKHLREIVLDTETTGLSIKEKHKIIEIGCVELINKVKTGAVFQAYINPQRSIAEEAFYVHGISLEFLQNKPLFAAVGSDFLNFIGKDAKLVIHNAQFDIGFLNYELAMVGLPLISNDRVVDTLVMARKKFPGSPVSLDALCKRFSISLEKREKHGALLDAELLAGVYIVMHTNVQIEIQLAKENNLQNLMEKAEARKREFGRKFNLTDEELAAHETLLTQMQNPLWNKV